MMSPRFFQFFRYLNWRTLQQTLICAGRQRLSGLAAEMAYNATLSLFPAILTMVTAIGLFASLRLRLNVLAIELIDLAPPEVQDLIHGFVQDLGRSRNRSLFSLSFVVAIWAASGVIGSAMAAFDQIQRTPRRLIRPFWQARIVAIKLLIGTLFWVILAVGIIVVSDIVIYELAIRSGMLGLYLLILWKFLSRPVALVILTIAVAFLYRYGPSRWNPHTPILPGAMIAALLWVFISNLFQIYLVHFGDYNRTYGTIGAVIILLLWLYMSSLVLLLGKQLNVVVGETMRQQVRRSEILPKTFE
ncbi:MAG: YihY/virulence factor BrkB family protein [Leptolyngbyaceae cyanobacterium bins.59]|nr:YihY/virulence factor BrkB family protein [Leptolyngbyaceae cyanobacterium bins.59]